MSDDETALILIPAKTAADLEVDVTGAARNARNAPKTGMEWAGTCGGCHCPIWAREAPSKGVPRRCPDCGGEKLFQYWMVPVRVPANSALLKTATQGGDTRIRKFPQNAPMKSEASNTHNRDGGTAKPQIASGRAFRPGRPARLTTAERIAQERERARQYRQRKRTVDPLSP